MHTHKVVVRVCWTVPIGPKWWTFDGPGGIQSCVLFIGYEGSPDWIQGLSVKDVHFRRSGKVSKSDLTPRTSNVHLC